jgi:serine/threonine protein kinase
MDLADISTEFSVDELLIATNNLSESRMIGNGSYGSVYRGVLYDGTEVAIKVFSDHVPDNGFEEEIRILSKIRHPNIVLLIGFARTHSHKFIVYERLDTDLNSILKLARENKQPFTYEKRISILIDAATGLCHMQNAAQRRAFHRDIKPSNILIDKNGTAKMADFGLSCVTSDIALRVESTSGTLGYACPGYVKTGIVTEGSEVYSFGVLICELLTNLPPVVTQPNGAVSHLVDFIHGNIQTLKEMADPEWPSDIAEAMADVAIRAVAVDESSRPSFMQIVHRLRKIQQMFSSTSSPNTVPSPIPTHKFHIRMNSTCIPIDDHLIFGRDMASAQVGNSTFISLISREHLEFFQCSPHLIRVKHIGSNPVIVFSPSQQPFFLSANEEMDVSEGTRISFISKANDHLSTFLTLTIESISDENMYGPSSNRILEGAIIGYLERLLSGSAGKLVPIYEKSPLRVGTNISRDCFEISYHRPGNIILTSLCAEGILFEAHDDRRRLLLPYRSSARLEDGDIIGHGDQILYKFKLA